MIVFGVTFGVLAALACLYSYRRTKALWGKMDADGWLVVALSSAVGSAIALCVAGAVCVLTTGIDHEYATGSTTVTPTQVSHVGVIWKTWETHGYTNEASDDIAKCSASESVAAEMEKHIGKRIRIEWSKWIIQPAWRGDSACWVDSFTVED